MKTFTASIFLALALPSLAFGQALPIDKLTPPLPTQGERKAADAVSTATVLTSIALDTLASWQSANRPRAFLMQGIRLGVTGAAVFTAKKLVERDRPCEPTLSCGTDDPYASFYSGHTAFAFQAVGGPRLAVALPLAIGTGGLRIAAGKHWLSDTLVGAVAGLAASRIR